MNPLNDPFVFILKPKVLSQTPIAFFVIKYLKTDRGVTNLPPYIDFVPEICLVKVCDYSQNLSIFLVLLLSHNAIILLILVTVYLVYAVLMILFHGHTSKIALVPLIYASF